MSTGTETAAKGAAIVTGSAQGIGRAIALRLAADGYNITLNDIPEKKEILLAVTAEIEALGRRAIAVQGDVSKEEDVVALVQATVNTFGTLKVMVANAAIAHHGPVAEMDVEKWDKVFSINVRGVMLCYKHAAKQMIAQGEGGRIIGAASTASKTGQALASVYCASKFAVRGLTQSAALELGKFGITVNAYAPGAINTTFLENFAKYHASHGTVPSEDSFSEILKDRVAMKRLGTPEDVAALVSFLARDESSFITGQSILTEGGGLFD